MSTRRFPKAPCKECPFRRTAPPGWLGGGEIGRAADYLAEAHSDRDIACHVSVRAADRAPLRKFAHSCVGLAIYRNNVHKLPRDGNARAAVMRTAPDPVTVFAKPAEFMERHDTDLNRRMMVDLRGVR